ncbi:Fanconi anemia group D2 protein isoform X2 [Phymastichus coffea]|uniref:Fanconi anemia group D2 protein isoform X2 n=1 Tax=Phymastichus coffea TaxID=108790 RepID=UPI00273AAF8C|nr:Fanconi anemia group D2 protein isoform X2 [Phymastichus coffea]
MDRRKIVSRNPLHKQLYSSSQIVKTSVSEGFDIVRSVSTINENLSVSRKRKNSEDQENDDILSVLPSTINLSNAKKKRRNIINNSDDDGSEEEASLPPERNFDKNDKDTSKEEKSESSKCNSGSSIKNFLETLDKSPAKLSQSSNSSTEKYRKMNLRTPLRSRAGGAISKSLEAKVNVKPVNELRDSRTHITDLKKSLIGPALSKQKTAKTVVTDEEIASDTDVTTDVEGLIKESKNPRTKKNDLKKNFPGPASSKRRRQSIISDNEEMTSDTEITAKKVRSETREISPERLSISSVAPKSPDKTPIRNQNRIIDSPELSPLKTFQSPARVEERENITQHKKRPVNLNKTDDKFLDFVNAAGITLCSGENLYITNDNPLEVIKKMKELLINGSINQDQVVKAWKSYIEDEENLRKSFLEIRIESEERVVVSSKALSLVKLLLQVPQLQMEVFRSLFSKLIDAVMTTESADDAPWALQMIQQFRFLETIVDPDDLINLIEDLLSTSPAWFQREIIILIPDIITDVLHRPTAEMLVKIIESPNNTDLINIVLDAIYNLLLSKEYREEIREKVLKLLNTKFDKSIVPSITRFILHSCSSEAIALKCLNALREIDMAPSLKENADECYTYQSSMVTAINISIQLSKEVEQAAVTVIKSVKIKPLPFDLILSMLLYNTTAAKKKIVETNLLNHIKTGFYKTSLLGSLYSGYRYVVKSFQTDALNLAIGFLKADAQSYVEFGIEWVRYMFINQADTSYKQRDIMEKLLHLMNTKNKTVKNSLEVLIRMSNDENERGYLQTHVGFLKSFLEKIENLYFDDVATLYHLLHGLCTHSKSFANILNEDLFIIMQKQLCSSKVQIKCKGVLGAVMAIKHLACESETKDEAYCLTRKTIISLKDCKRSEALFYDQLANVIATTNDIYDDYLTSITNELEDHFIATCLVESSPNILVPRFGLIDSKDIDNNYLCFGNCKFGAYVSIFFKLLRICNMRTNGNLENINAMLGCPIFMPKDFDMPEPATADYMIHCINWFRETIGAFVEESSVRSQILKRLETLMSLQGEYVQMVAMLETRYQPPPCYFNYFPTPQFVRLDFKLGKKGKKGKKGDKKGVNDSSKIDSTLSKSNSLYEWEIWEKGSELTVKNPAFFRRMDTKIIYLLDMDLTSTQLPSMSVTIAQVCFIIRELLNMFETEVSESFMKEIILLLPKVCKKLQKIVANLRENDSAYEKEAVRLILNLFISIFNWKEFKNSKYRNLLRDGLRALAAMMNESSTLLRSCKDLVVEAYKYFESLADIATQITLAVALVKLCDTLIKYAETFDQQSKDQQAKMSYGYLSLVWNESHGPQYKAAIKELLKSWMENESDPLKTVSSVLEWLPTEIATLERSHSRLSRMPSVTKVHFHLLLKQLFVGLIKGVQVSLEVAKRDPQRIKIWSETGICLEKISDICKSNKYNLYLTFFLRYTTILYQILLSSGMSVLEASAKYQSAEVLNIIKSFQKSNRFLRDIFCTARKSNNVALLKLIPLAKSKREKFIYRVKGMLAANNSIGAFWMGTLLNKDLDGEEVDAESSEEITDPDIIADNSIDDAVSEIIESDSDEEINVDE